MSNTSQEKRATDRWLIAEVLAIVLFGISWVPDLVWPRWVAGGLVAVTFGGLLLSACREYRARGKRLPEQRKQRERPEFSTSRRS